MSTILWTRTKKFPPLVRIDGSEGMDQKTADLFSYGIVEESIWTAIIEPKNRFRQHVLGSQNISSTVEDL
ncbi:hypothetical protein ETB97_009467 [Aspergillus alliaceus]|uniref:Uncharacterized protein n=1 Tax=Petromyces alliaceus TaxID=209559 RepID=A0A8H5ZR46_PETAA|nr:hypothetical protein ETB97_009467 [Aspergillus burnettii]